MTLKTYGFIMIAFGIIYIIKPNVFKAGIWKKTAITQQVFSPKQYGRYIRILGVFAIILGLYFILR